MKITLDINDNRFSYFMEMLKSLDFVKVISKEDDARIVSEPPIHYASEKALAKDWLSPEEDQAWKDL